MKHCVRSLKLVVIVFMAAPLTVVAVIVAMMPMMSVVMMVGLAVLVRMVSLMCALTGFIKIGLRLTRGILFVTRNRANAIV